MQQKGAGTHGFDVDIIIDVGQSFGGNIAVSSLLLMLCRLLCYSSVPYMTAKLIIGCLSIPTLHALVCILSIRDANFLAVWGTFLFDRIKQ